MVSGSGAVVKEKAVVAKGQF